MNIQHDDFTQLRRLLALKRHEQPPPGYFESFSRTVMVRIAAGEHVRDYSIFEALSWEAPWLQWLWAALERKPLYTGAFGVAVCGLLLTGALVAERRDANALASQGAPPVVAEQAANKTGLARSLAGTVGSLDGKNSLLGPVNSLQAQPVLFSPGK